MLTEKDYCDYDTCVALKELGYNEKSNWWFSKYLNEDSGQMELVHICDNPAHLNYDSWGIVPKDFVIRPSLYEAQKWLREEKDIIVDIVFSPLGYFACIYTNARLVDSEHLKRCFKYQWDDKVYADSESFTYEEALSEGIKAAVKILKDE